MSKVFSIILAIIVGFCAGFITYAVKPWEEAEPATINTDETLVEDNYVLSITTVEEIIKPASDLITSKYIYKDADTYEDYKELFGKKVPFTTDKVVFTYKGTISVGIDLSNVQYSIDNENRSITINLPKNEIISNEIDNSSFEYPFESDSVFNTSGMSDFTELLAKLKDKKQKEVMNNKEFMDSAVQDTKNVLEDFLTAADATKEYKVIFE